MKQTPLFEIRQKNNQVYQIAQVDDKGETIDSTLCKMPFEAFPIELHQLCEQAPAAPDWFTLENEKPKLRVFPFVNRFDKEVCLPFIKNVLKNNYDENEMYDFGCRVYDASRKQAVKLGKSEEVKTKELYNTILSQTEQYHKEQEKYELDLNIFSINRQIAWKHYHAFLTLKKRNEMFEVVEF